MKVRALANGNIVELNDVTAKQLIEARIYEPFEVEESEPKSALQPKGRKPPR